MMKIQDYIRDHRAEFLATLFIAALASVVVLSIFPSSVDKGWLPALLMPMIILAVNYLQRLNTVGRVVVLSFILAVVLIFGFNSIQELWSLSINPPLWDFHVFWISGRVASQGLNFYAPVNFYNVALPLNLGEEFTREILDVGFWYPPMTMFLFAPLGWFDIQTAAIIWNILQAIVLAFDIFLLWKLFLSDMGLIGLAFTIALVLVFPPIINNIWFSQMNFIVLLVLLLFWRDRQNVRAGIWLAIGIILKPYVAFLFVYLLIKRQWKMIASSLFTLILTAFLSLIVFGSQTFFSYFINNPAGNLPPWFFSELDKGNLYALIWRLDNSYLSDGSLGLTQPIFMLVSIVLILFTSWLIYRLVSIDHDEWGLAVALALALLIYPNAGTNYYVAIMAPILLLWVFRNELPGNVWGVAAFMTLESALLGYHRGWSELVTVAMILNWLMFSAFGLSLLLRFHKNHDTVVR